tara:strand:- start:126 stop:269 length:144 start_codon:yes stop_codon:yes gene_type:complete
MYRVDQTAEFEGWLDGLGDRRAQLKIAQRILRLEAAIRSTGNRWAMA